MGRMDESAECTALTETLGGKGGRFTDSFEGVAATAEEGDDDGVAVDEGEAGADCVAEGEVADVAEGEVADVDEGEEANKVLDGVFGTADGGEHAMVEVSGVIVARAVLIGDEEESAPATAADTEAAEVEAAEEEVAEVVIEAEDVDAPLAMEVVTPAADG